MLVVEVADVEEVKEEEEVKENAEDEVVADPAAIGEIPVARSALLLLLAPARLRGRVESVRASSLPPPLLNFLTDRSMTAEPPPPAEEANIRGGGSEEENEVRGEVLAASTRGRDEVGPPHRGREVRGERG